MPDPAPIEFQFVNSTITTPTVPQDLEIRALIRKQAMKKASAARRRDGNYGKHNLRQFPVFVYGQHDGAKSVVGVRSPGEQYGYSFPHSICKEEDDGHAHDRDARLKHSKHEKGGKNQRWLARLAMAESIPHSLSAKGYELKSVQTGFDILDLSTLATLHVGRAARSTLSTNPYQLIHQLRSNKQWSYLSFLPSRYGHIPCLSDAADCVIARAQQIISPSEHSEAAVISCYVKALDSLQRAIDCPKQRYKPEVLCATEILALYEFLDPSGETAWIRHAAGAARLIQLRGPQNYNTEFEKALFMAHTGAMMTEALLNSQRCFLEQDAWRPVFRSVIIEGSAISDRSEIFISLLMLKSRVPGTFVDVSDAVLNKTGLDLPAISEIEHRNRGLRADLLHWHEDYERILARVPEICPGTIEYDRRCKVFATYLSCLMITSRLLAALSSPERADLEKEIQDLAQQMLDLEREVRSTSSQTLLFMAQTVGVAQATIATSPDWIGVESEVGKEQPQRMIEKGKFERWCKSFGRNP